MNFGVIVYIVVTFGRALEHNPGRLVPILAFACVITLIIALVSDAWLRARPAREKKAEAVKDGTTLR
jgi:hypothetical protein